MFMIVVVVKCCFKIVSLMSFFFSLSLREVVAKLLNNLKETKLKIYKSVFVGAVVSSELFKQKGQFYSYTNSAYKRSSVLSLHIELGLERFEDH